MGVSVVGQRDSLHRPSERPSADAYLEDAVAVATNELMPPLNNSLRSRMPQALLPPVHSPVKH